MSTKRSALQILESRKRQKSNETLSYLKKTLQESGLILKNAPEKCEATLETVYIIRNIKKKLTQHPDFPANLNTFYSDFKTECADDDTFKHYLFLNIIKKTDSGDITNVNDSVIKILLNVSLLQNELVNFIFDKAMDVLSKPKKECEEWIQTILKSFSTLNMVMNSKGLSSKLMDLLEVCSDNDVRLKIILHIPDIIGDQEHDDVASKMSGLMVEDNYLLPAILDCWSYLCLSDKQYDQLHKNTLNIMTPSNAAYFSCFVKFLLAPTRMNDNAYIETVNGLRRELAWSKLVTSEQEIATSQILTAGSIRTSMLASKSIAKAWTTVLSSCKLSTDHWPIDIVILIIMYSASHDYHKTVEDIIKQQVKSQVLTEKSLDEAFEKFLTIIMMRDNLVSLMSLANALLKAHTEPSLQAFALHIYALLFAKTDSETAGSVIVAELLQLGLNCKQSVMSILNILNKVATDNMSLLRPHSMMMLNLFDQMDDMSPNEIRAVMNLVCCLAYSSENSVIRNDVDIIIRKELSSSLPSVKIPGILAGLHAVKYLMRNVDEENIDIPEDVTLSSINCFPGGELREAASLIDLINRSTMLFPDMIPFFYDELFKIVQSTPNINKSFLLWLMTSFTNDLQNNFIVEELECEKYGEIPVSLQCHLNAESEIDAELSFNIAGLTLEVNEEVHIGSLSPLFQLVRALHARQNDGNLSDINALLGCSVLMPAVDVHSIDEYDDAAVSRILDCLVHCVNLFRELLNAFASQDQTEFISKILNRIYQLRTYENMIEQILLNRNMSYKAPTQYLYTANNSNIGVQAEKRAVKPKNSKQTAKNVNKDDTIIPESGRTQPTQVGISIKNKLDTIHKINLRPLDLSLLDLLNCELSADDLPEKTLGFEVLNYLMKHINGKIEKILIPKIKKKTFLTNHVDYDRAEAEKQAGVISEILPKISTHINFITQFLDHHALEDDEMMYTTKIMESVSSLEHLYNLCTVYFNWVDFKSNNFDLLKKSLKYLIIQSENSDTENLEKENLLEDVAKYLQAQGKYCLVLSTAVSLTGFITALQEHSTGPLVPMILRNVAQSFLSKQWKTPDGVAEKGIVYNQYINILIKAYLSDMKIGELKDLVSVLVDKIHDMLKGSNNALPLFKSINKHNFPILYKGLGTALGEIVKQQAQVSSTMSHHLSLWTNVSLTVKYMFRIVTTLDRVNISSDFCKNVIRILNVFLRKGLPILKKEFDQNSLPIKSILEDFGLVCSHAKLNSDHVLKKKSSDWIFMTENFNCQVKDVCPEALKVPHGESRRNGAGRASIDTRAYHNETVDDCDDQLQDDDSDDSEDDTRAGSEERSAVV